MAYTEYFDYTTGLNLYAKAKPLDTGTWATGVIALTENGSTGEYSASTFVDDTSYNIYEETTSPGTPASTDTKIGSIAPPMSSDIASIEADLLLIKEKTDQINAYDVYPPTRQAQNTVTVYLGETTSLSFVTASDYSAKTLNVVWRDADDVLVANTPDAGITKTTTTITVDSLPTAVTEEVRILSYAIRDSDDGDRVLAYGECYVKYAATSS